MVPQPRTTKSAEEYLAFERSTDQRHEYDGAAIYPMAGASEQHIQICVNLYGLFYNQFRRRDCMVYTSDMRVHIPLSGLYTYPDVSALCGSPQFLDGHRDTLLNPTVIIEVLSPSTETYDRGKKFRNYRTLPSLQEYLLIEQDTMHVEHYTRQPNGQWLLAEVSELRESLVLSSIDCALEVMDIYEKVLPDQTQDRAP
ncbi:MAG: hypothetical protein AVDCRST_MAG93-4866 [uncultured Chloroflexia bacterium]|uniref:Putative restriction endonuclease domain-containing protein n=1 Tax=uncultured Chloroflexia bacterium TaxID=1672391 RepID=A0A6J4KHY4_9CHLR|nr:MAG: hypothetical protein AVDCRST_MAG93-4866 [uncultured Chloroflexia bacterium]